MEEVDVPDESLSELLDSAFENFTDLNESTKKNEIPKSDNDENIFKNFETELNNCLKNLSDSLGNLSDPKLFEEDLNKDFDEPSTTEIDSLLQGLLHQFLSKDLVYPPLKAVALKYPQWLTDNACKLSSDEFKERVKQSKMIEEVCSIYESYEINVEISGDDLQKIMNLIEEAMSNGPPPSDLVDSMDADDTSNAFKNMMNSVNSIYGNVDMNNCGIM